MEFHERLKLLREESGLTQKKLGEQLNYGSSAIANYESGRNQPSIPDLKKIANCFHVSMDYLLGMSEIRNPYTEEQNSIRFDQLRQYFVKISERDTDMLIAFAEFLTTYDSGAKFGTSDKPTRRDSQVLHVAEPTATYTASKKYPIKE